MLDLNETRIGICSCCNVNTQRWQLCKEPLPLLFGKMSVSLKHLWLHIINIQFVLVKAILNVMLHLCNVKAS